MSHTKLRGTCAKCFALMIVCLSTLQASYVTANINSGGNGGVCGSVSPIDPGEACAGAPNVSPVGVAATFSDANGSYDARAQAGYGLNRVYVASTATNSGVQAATEWMVVYTLTGGTPGTAVEFLLSIDYDVSVSVSGSSFAGFRMVLNGDVYFPYDINTTGNGFASDSCFDRPGQTALGACAGRHTGTITRTVSASIGPNNRLGLSVGAGTFGSGAVDAYHTITVAAVTLPNGIGWEYQGVAGNPLNFRNASDASAVPEPAALQLMGAGLSVAVIVIRRKRAKRG
jgi:hypothetical protein